MHGITSAPNAHYSPHPLSGRLIVGGQARTAEPVENAMPSVPTSHARLGIFRFERDAFDVSACKVTWNRIGFFFVRLSLGAQYVNAAAATTEERRISKVFFLSLAVSVYRKDILFR